MNKIVTFALLAGLAPILGSCIKENPDDCRVRVEFQYTYNMLSADALSEQVDELMLYVFNAEGILVYTSGMRGGVAQTPVSITIDLLAAGHYSFVAWGRSNAVSDPDAVFEIPGLTVGQSSIEELKYRLRTNAGVQSTELNSFLVGMAEAEVRVDSDDRVVIGMKKVTNKIRVVIFPYTGGSDLGADDYSFRIEDPVGNGLVNYDFDLLTDAPVTYTPYFSAIITPAPGENPMAPQVDRALAVEMSTSRLLESHAPRLKITSNAIGVEIVDINLPWLFSLTSMEEHRDWSLQEYLDRQDEYVITLFFQDNSWMNASIIINGWVINSVTLGN